MPDETAKRSFLVTIEDAPRRLSISDCNDIEHAIWRISLIDDIRGKVEVIEVPVRSTVRVGYADILCSLEGLSLVEVEMVRSRLDDLFPTKTTIVGSAARERKSKINPEGYGR
jgi:hypothetical protein